MIERKGIAAAVGPSIMGEKERFGGRETAAAAAGR